MTFLIAAAGTGGHVFPGLAVAEALTTRGVAHEEILFVGGDRMEASVYSGAGFPFLGLELRGLQRSWTLKNLGLPRVVWTARNAILAAIRERPVEVALGMGGYVTVPTALAARKAGIPLLVAEQNADAGMANRIVSRWAERSFTSFPHTNGLENGEWVGNPVRAACSGLDRQLRRPEALAHYGLQPGLQVLGVFGGSLGAGVINAAIAALVGEWSGKEFQVVHLTGGGNVIASPDSEGSVTWVQRQFEDQMEMFYAVSDLVVARAGGAVAELTATETPSILIPGAFGSSGHQAANARFLEEAGAAVVLTEDRIGELPRLIEEILFDQARLETMKVGARTIAKPEAALTIADAMLDLAR
ncbi:MAG: UDP-N-acetylglucosamine--N-acetylmuramyl-(pentapeptide) pyrophosphoryl-undecaprenol N-acetylglucosamine transferase [Acidimicrobiia bacterium]